MNDQYDPQATEDEASSKSQYFNFRDIKVLAIVMIALIILLIPIYNLGKKNSEKARCVQNFRSMFDAINVYAKDHDDGFPPLYVVGPDGAPDVDSKGHPYAWISDTAGYMSTRASFNCPSADPSEAVTVQSPTGGPPIVSTYGMYAPYGGVKTFNVEHADSTVLLAETSNGGGNDTFDPAPYKNDGIAMGWDDSNFQSSVNSKMITRLAFKGSGKGNLSEAQGRHDGRDEKGPYTGIHALTAGGELIILRPTNARVTPRADKLPGGYWNVPSLRK